MNKSPSKLIPALIGGTIIGFLSALPIINMGNCLCCMWVILGGGLSVYFYWRELPPQVPINSGDGILVGLLAGLFGALFGTFLNYIFMVFGFAPWQDIFQNILENTDEMTPELEELLNSFNEGKGLSQAMVLFMLIVNIIQDSIFGMIGGLIGVRLLKNREKPQHNSSNPIT